MHGHLYDWPLVRLRETCLYVALSEYYVMHWFFLLQVTKKIPPFSKSQDLDSYW